MQNHYLSIPGFPSLTSNLPPQSSGNNPPSSNLRQLIADDLLNSTRQELGEAAQSAANLVANGEVDPLRALIYAKKGIELFTLYEKQVRPLAEGGHGIAQKEVYQACNAEVVEKETGISIDYAACHDPVWNQYQQDLQQLKAVIKNREAYLKTITRPTEALINGCEVITLHPPLRKSRLGLAVWLK